MGRFWGKVQKSPISPKIRPPKSKKSPARNPANIGTALPFRLLRDEAGKKKHKSIRRVGAGCENAAASPHPSVGIADDPVPSQTAPPSVPVHLSAYASRALLRRFRSLPSDRPPDALRVLLRRRIAPSQRACGPLKYDVVCSRTGTSRQKKNAVPAPGDAAKNQMQKTKQKGSRNMEKKTIEKKTKRPGIVPGQKQKNGWLTALYRTEKRYRTNAIWHCICECGKECDVIATAFSNETTKSCGCYARDRTIESHTSHGDASTKSPYFRLYRIFYGMHTRCENPNDAWYHRYGGRGIKVCKEWNDYQTFKTWALQNGYSSNLTIDRINNDGNYTPENCRWSTPKEQAENKTQTGHMLTHNNITQNVSQWAVQTGIARNTINKRLKLGWTIEEALTIPTGQKRTKPVRNKNTPKPDTKTP